MASSPQDNCARKGYAGSLGQLTKASASSNYYAELRDGKYADLLRHSESIEGGRYGVPERDGVQSSGGLGSDFSVFPAARGMFSAFCQCWDIDCGRYSVPRGFKTAVGTI